MIKTMLGETVEKVSEFDDCVCIDNGLMLSKEDFEAVKLPKLNEDERKYYDKIKRMNNGDKRGMATDVIFGVMNGNCNFEYGGVYRVIEAIVKGGYNS